MWTFFQGAVQPIASLNYTTTQNCSQISFWKIYLYIINKRKPKETIESCKTITIKFSLINWLKWDLLVQFAGVVSSARLYNENTTLGAWNIYAISLEVTSITLWISVRIHDPNPTQMSLKYMEHDVMQQLEHQVFIVVFSCPACLWPQHRLTRSTI